MGIQLLTVASTAQNTFTAWGLLRNYFNLSIAASSVWNGTITAQRKFGSTGTTKDVTSYSTSVEDVGLEPEDNVYYRAGVKTGDYVAGTATIRLSQ